MQVQRSPGKRNSCRAAREYSRLDKKAMVVLGLKGGQRKYSRNDDFISHVKYGWKGASRTYTTDLVLKSQNQHPE